MLKNPQIAGLFVETLAKVRDVHGFKLLAWVVMPEHVHLLIWPKLPESSAPVVLRSLKQPVSQRVVARWKELDASILKKITDSQGIVRFWQRGGGFDRNVRDENEYAEVIKYIHGNPVKRGLVEKSTDWKWSSARWYCGDKDGELPMDRVERPE